MNAVEPGEELGKEENARQDHHDPYPYPPRAPVPGLAPKGQNARRHDLLKKEAAAHSKFSNHHRGSNCSLEEYKIIADE
jgi:hypothetical protein